MSNSVVANVKEAYMPQEAIIEESKEATTEESKEATTAESKSLIKSLMDVKKPVDESPSNVRSKKPSIAFRRTHSGPGYKIPKIIPGSTKPDVSRSKPLFPRLNPMLPVQNSSSGQNAERRGIKRPADQDLKGIYVNKEILNYRLTIVYADASLGETFTDDELKILEKAFDAAVLDAIMKGNKPRLEGVKTENSRFIIYCADQSTNEWIRNCCTYIFPLIGGKALKAMTYADYEPLTKITAYVAEPDTEEEAFLKALNAQNDGLHPLEWKSYGGHNPTTGGKVFTYGIRRNVLKVLESLHFRPYYLTRRVYIKVLKGKNSPFYTNLREKAGVKDALE